MSKDVKKCYRAFSIFDYDKEEKWLRKMHKNGWKLRKSGKFVYTFDKCENEDAVYKLDFPSNNTNENDYINMFENYGWEFVRECNNFYCFRKPIEIGAEIKEEEFEIFNDDESKIQMMKRIFKGKMLPILILFVTIVMPNIIKSIQRESYPLIILWTIIFITYIFTMLKCFIGYKRNSDKIDM